MNIYINLLKKGNFLYKYLIYLLRKIFKIIKKWKYKIIKIMNNKYNLFKTNLMNFLKIQANPKLIQNNSTILLFWLVNL